MNYLRKSTDGFSIGMIMLDCSGAIFNFSQMVVQSIDQGFSKSTIIIVLDLSYPLVTDDVSVSRFLGEFLWKHWESTHILGQTTQNHNFSFSLPLSKPKFNETDLLNIGDIFTLNEEHSGNAGDFML